MKKSIGIIALIVLMSSCKEESNKNSIYTDSVKTSLNELNSNGEINKEDIQLIEKYIDGSKYDSSFVNVNNKSYLEILELAKQKIEDDNITLDKSVIENLENNEEILSTVICANQPVPNGYVIIRYGNSMSCPGWSPGAMNTKTISLPSNNQTICSNSPVPSGYVVTRYGNSQSCPGWTPGGMNTKTITKPGNQATVCYNSPIPDGYVVTGYGNSQSCPGWSPGNNNTKRIKKL